MKFDGTEEFRDATTQPCEAHFNAASSHGLAKPWRDASLIPSRADEERDGTNFERSRAKHTSMLRLPARIYQAREDNGQVQVSKILASVFSAMLPNPIYRKVLPKDYKLFQVADLLFTFTLNLKIKPLRKNGIEKARSYNS